MSVSENPSAACEGALFNVKDANARVSEYSGVPKIWTAWSPSKEGFHGGHPSGPRAMPEPPPAPPPGPLGAPWPAKLPRAARGGLPTQDFRLVVQTRYKKLASKAPEKALNKNPVMGYFEHFSFFLPQR